MKLALLLLALLLAGCATKSTLDIEAIRREQEARYSTRTIQIQTLPPGAIIDRNNDIVGVSPCQLELPRCWDGKWPGAGYYYETLRARWTDGYAQEQTFVSNTTVPKNVVFLHPNPAKILPQAPTLIQR